MRSLLLLFLSLGLFELLSLGCVVFIQEIANIWYLTGIQLVLLHVLGHLIAAGLLRLFVKLGGSGQ